MKRICYYQAIQQVNKLLSIYTSKWGVIFDFENWANNMLVLGCIDLNNHKNGSKELGHFRGAQAFFRGSPSR